MRSLMLGAVLAAVSLSTAGAQEATSVAVAAKDAAAQAPRTELGVRKIFVCDNRDLTRRSFAREYGSIEFITADQAVKPNTAWTAPKCMRSSEHMRLKRLQLAAR
jgi:hypothetical protein